MNKQSGQTNKQTNKQRDFANQGDTISRHGVYAWLCNMGHEHLADAIMDENRFPSAQSDIIRCGECRHLHDNDCPVVGWGRNDDDYCAWAERDNDG